MGVEVPDDFYQDQDDAASGSEELISDDEGDEEDDDETDEGKQKIIAAGIKSVSDAQKKAADSAAKKPKLGNMNHSFAYLFNKLLVFW